MTKASLSRLFSAPEQAARDPSPHLAPWLARASASRDDELHGRVEGGAKASPPRAGQKLDSRLGGAPRPGGRQGARGGEIFVDRRQRAIVKIHFFGHGGGGAQALSAHARYVAREAARESDEQPRDAGANREGYVRDHAGYLARGNDQTHPFYDALTDGVDGRARLAVWGREDRRHFRVIIAPEAGAELRELRPYVRELMERAEKALGTRLEWVAVDHWDTDNPHTHVVLRGRRANGRDLLLPKPFVKAGFRNLARDVATEILGERSPADDRRALQREIRAHRLTRLDTLLAGRLETDGRLRLADLRANEARLADAMKARAKELQHLGLASEIRRGVLLFDPNWRARLSALEAHLDIRKSVMRRRAVARTPVAIRPLGPDR
jgi:type IV secretory pathway VirD2 relaxase